MKLIEMLTDVKHDGSYYKGEVRAVTPELAGYFVGLGWARYPGEPVAEADTAPVTLEIQNGKHGHGAANVGAK